MKKTLSRMSVLAGAALVCFAPIPGFAQGVEVLVRAFENNREYVKPFSTLYGSISNSGWYQSASVGKGFGFYIGMPLSITHIADDDRSLDSVYRDDGCVRAHQLNPTGITNCRENAAYTSPTIFGRAAAPIMYRSVTDVNGNIFDTLNIPLSTGMVDMARMNWIPFGMPQVSASFYHTEVKFRWLGIPEIKGVSFGMFGFGLQHDLASFLPRIVPNMPVNISLATNMTWLSSSFAPGVFDDSISGTVALNGFSHFLGIIVGYTYRGWVEAFLETGWEGSSIKTGGNLKINHITDPVENIRPRVTLDGRNAFRAGINLTIHFGYNATVGQSMGANFGQSVDILSYRYK